LPTFAFAGFELIKRLTMIAHAGRIEEVFYPVFPSDADAGRVIEWLTSHIWTPSQDQDEFVVDGERKRLQSYIRHLE
jgi:hypothetical protein